MDMMRISLDIGDLIDRKVMDFIGFVAEDWDIRPVNHRQIIIEPLLRHHWPHHIPIDAGNHYL